MKGLRGRVAAYIENLRSIADQVEQLVLQIEAARMDVNPETQGLRDTVKLHRSVADDLDKILRNEKLEHWVITGTIPGPTS